MVVINVKKLGKNGIMQEYEMYFKGTKEEMLEIEKLADIAEDSAVDKLDSWK